jgi:hypothetical protein
MLDGIEKNVEGKDFQSNQTAKLEISDFCDHCCDEVVLSDSSHWFFILDVSDQTSVVYHQEKYYIEAIKTSQILLNFIDILKNKLKTVQLSPETEKDDAPFINLEQHMRDEDLFTVMLLVWVWLYL